MRARTSSGLRLGWLTSSLLAIAFLPSPLSASSLQDTARQLARQIAAEAGPSACALQISNRSSLDDRSVREVRAALEAELHARGFHSPKVEQAVGTIEVVLSESLREYVWTAEMMLASGETKVALVSLPRSSPGTTAAATLPVVLKASLLFAQERPMFDAALVDLPAASRLLVLADSTVTLYRLPPASQAAASPVGRWEFETSLPIAHARIFPRDVRGRLLLRHDHLFDVHLPGTFCRSNSTAPLTLACIDSDDPWPLTPEDGSVRAVYAAARNFFTGKLSPSIGRISDVPSFYSATALPRSGYTLWVIAAVDGSVHLVDGVTDQSMPGANAKWGDLAAVHSNCGAPTQLLVSESAPPGRGDAERDALRAFEIPERDPVAASPALQFDGQITALWPDGSGNGATAIVRRRDTGWYEAYRVSVSCGN